MAGREGVWSRIFEGDASFGLQFPTNYAVSACAGRRFARTPRTHPARCICIIELPPQQNPNPRILLIFDAFHVPYLHVIRRWHLLSHSGRALVALGLLTACSGSSDPAPVPRDTATDRNPDAGGGNSRVKRVTLEVANTQLEPGEATTLTVQVSPPDVYAVQLALLGGDSHAYLERPTLETNADGLATTTLTVVPRSEPARITVLARANDKSVSREVEVLEPTVADLTLVPVYAGGRAFTQWEMLWGPHLSCDLGHDSPEWRNAVVVDRKPVDDDGVAPEYEHLGVSARYPVTVLVRAQRYAYGCVSGVRLTAKANNRVEVNVNQRLADVSHLDFPMQFNVAPDNELWAPLLGTRDESPYIASLAGAFRGSASSDIGALLDVMSELVPTSHQDDYRRRRSTAAWDSVLATRLSPEGAQSGLSSRILRWLQDGASLLQSPNAFVGNLRVHEGGQRSEVEMEQIAGHDAEVCKIPRSHLASVTVDTQDVLRVGFDLRFLPSPLFTCLADIKAAGAADAGISDVLSALAVDFDCGLVATWMAQASDGVLYEGCDGQCGAALCREGLEVMWQRVVEKDLNASSFQVNAAGKAELSADAVVVGVEANWVGTTSVTGKATSVSGSLRSCAAETCQ